MKYNALLASLSRQIWDYAELKFNEYNSAALLAETLRNEGFSVEENLAEMPTAFRATYGKGTPIIGFLGEYDALSGLSQEADLASKNSLAGQSAGHGCGHHLLGTASLGAALLVRDYLQQHNLPGTVTFIGCPAEEGGSGKAYLARAGIFDELSAALTWHPGSVNMVMTGSLQANCQVYYRFSGVSAHAAAAPHLGRSALDAVELMNVGVNYLREHMESTDRVHYAVTDTGGTSPNVVQSHAEVLYLIRSTTSEKVGNLYERVNAVARGAAMMTGTTVEIIFDKACSNIMPNSALEQLLYDSAQKIGVPTYTEEELTYAWQFKNTITTDDMLADFGFTFTPAAKRNELLDIYQSNAVCDFLMDHQSMDINIPGSSDVGDVSYVTPTAQIWASCYALGTPAHSWQMVAQGKSNIAVKGMVFAAEVLAQAAITLFTEPDILCAAKAEFKKRTGNKPYVCPIPASVHPNQNKKN